MRRTLTPLAEEVRDAIENARTVGINRTGSSLTGRHSHSFGTIRTILLSVLNELSDEITVAELRDELTITANQEGR
jgi:hypothetical protein